MIPICLLIVLLVPSLLFSMDEEIDQHDSLSQFMNEVLAGTVNLKKNDTADKQADGILTSAIKQGRNDVVQAILTHRKRRHPVYYVHDLKLLKDRLNVHDDKHEKYKSIELAFFKHYKWSRFSFKKIWKALQNTE